MELTLSRYPSHLSVHCDGRDVTESLALYSLFFPMIFNFAILYSPPHIVLHPHMPAFKGSNVIFPKGHRGRVVHCRDADVKLCMRPSCSWEMSMIFWLLSPDFCCFTFEFQCSTPTNTNESFYIFYASHTPEGGCIRKCQSCDGTSSWFLFPWNLILHGECETEKETMFQES